MIDMNKKTEKKKINRVMIAAGSSSSGKTMITCGLLKALKNRGLDLNAYKCGPDYIDPMFHSTVLNIESENLDSYLSSKDQIIRIMFFKHSSYFIYRFKAYCIYDVAYASLLFLYLINDRRKHV